MTDIEEKKKIPKRGEFVINPNTNRPVKIGSRIWTELVKKGIIDGKYQDPNELCEIEEITDVETKIEEMNKKLPKYQQAVRGRGIYKNKLVIRNKAPTTQEITEFTAKSASKVIKNNQSLITNDDIDLEDELEKMIIEEMMKTRPIPMKKSAPIKVPTKNKFNSSQEKYYTQEPEEYDYDSYVEDKEETEFYN